MLFSIIFRSQFTGALIQSRIAGGTPIPSQIVSKPIPSQFTDAFIQSQIVGTPIPSQIADDFKPDRWYADSEPDC